MEKLPKEILARYELAQELAQELGRYALSAKQTMRISDKGISDCVTNVDVAIEKELSKKILAAFPDDVIQGEELTPRENREPRWIIDPIDGTKNYIHDLQMWAVSIGYKDEVSHQSFGVVYFPDLDQLFHALDGHGAFLNGKTIKVSSQTKLKKAYAHIDTFNFEAHPAITGKRWPLYQGIFRELFRVRNLGVATYALCYVAKGSFDININLSAMHHEWDYFPPLIIIREAGGVYEIVDGVAFVGNETIVTKVIKTLQKSNLLAK